MKRIMVSAAAVAALVFLAPAWSAPKRSKRAGKVVRVERPRLIAKTALRLCPMPFSDKTKGTCYGGAPEVGDTAALFDFDRHYLGQIKVTTVEPSASDPCHSGSAFDFTYEFVSRTPAAAQSRIPYALSFFGIDVDPAKAQLITDNDKLPVPGSVSKAQPWMGLDRDGDSSVDMVVTAFECKDRAPRPPNASGKTSETYCLDYWLGSDGAWTQVRRDYLYTCL